MAIGDAETIDFWTTFLRSQRERGLKVVSAHDPTGVVLVTSDAHEGIKTAVKAIPLGAGWQRCRVHFARNVTSRLGSAHSKPVNALIGTVFAQTTPPSPASANSSTPSTPTTPSTSPYPCRLTENPPPRDLIGVDRWVEAFVRVVGYQEEPDAATNRKDAVGTALACPDPRH